MKTPPYLLFFSYAHEDERLRINLGKQMILLEREGLISAWHDRKILPGQDWSDAIEETLKQSDIILLLVSPDFLASEYCYNLEMATALDLYNRGMCLVIPIFIRHVNVELTAFSKLQGLPRDGRPVSSWPNEDEVLANIAKEIRNSALQLQLQKENSPKSWSGDKLNPSNALQRDGRRIESYYRAFLRPAFSVPCIFEASLDALDRALDQITEAFAVGTVYTRDPRWFADQGPWMTRKLHLD